MEKARYYHKGDEKGNPLKFHSSGGLLEIDGEVTGAATGMAGEAI